MERSAKEIASYNRDYQHFIQNLQKFHGSRGSAFKKVPFFGGKELDLFLLYKTVTSLGGCAKVTDEKKWRDVAKCFNLPSSCTNAAFSLRQYYLRYLAFYEKLHFLGEDGDDNSSDLRRTGSSLFMQPPSVNFVSANFQEPSKRPEPGPLGEPKVNNFDRLMFAMVSGLPNEVDFALNICTLLSNVTNSIFNLAKAPSVVDLMLAHVGIFTEGETSMRELYKEWYQESDRDFDKFWKESIDDKTVKEIYDGSCAFTEPCSENLVNPFNENTSKLADSTEAKRVNQVCVILHNFSYEELNCLFISSHSTCKRFLILCAGSRLPLLRKTALDTLDNLAEKMTLNMIQDQETQRELRVLESFLFSKDRIRKVRALSILAKLSSHEENEDVLSEALPNEVYEELIRCLTIPDIQLILNSLDALYYLSDLGEATATAIVMVYRSLDILVCLVTVHAESYGNRAISGFRIVENKNSVHSQKHAALQQSHHRNIATQQLQRSYAQLHPPVQQSVISQVRASPKSQVPPSVPQVRPDVQKSDETEEVEPEIFAARWISAFYELAPGSDILRSQVYTDYIESCKDMGRKGVLKTQSFFKILGLVIPAPYWRPNENNREDPTITGIKRRLTPLVIKSKSAKTATRVPDVSSQQSMPVRPIPVMPANVSQQQKMAQLPGPQIPGQPQAVNPVALFPGQQQGPRGPVSASTLPSQTQMAVSLPQLQNGNQTIPLKLLEQHVNSQGQIKDPTSQNSATPQRESHANTGDATPKRGLLPQQNNAQQPVPSQAISSMQTPQPQFAKQSNAQGVVLSVSGTPTPGSNPMLLGNMAQSSQSPLLANQSIVGNLIAPPSADLAGGQTPNALDSAVKLNSQQKLSAKERNERKKAMKAARDMINADIKASNLDPLTQCQNLTERIQKEMQQHFVQFHVHQQSIQAIQAQLQQVVLQNQQAKLPQNVMEDIHTRVRNHHGQMQAHYQKLQQLQILLQQVKIRLTQEQKIKDPSTGQPDPANELSQNVSKTPKSSRSSRKQPSSIAANLPNQLPGSPAVFGISAMQPINIGPPGQVIAAGNIQQGPQFAFVPSGVAIKQVQSAAPQSTDATASSYPAANNAVISQSKTPASINPEVKPTVNQTLPAVIPAQVGLLANAPIQLQTSQGQTPVTVAGPGIQFTQVATPVKPGSTQMIPKQAGVTYNTPILPRPPVPTSMTIQNVASQNMQNPPLGGQAVLFTMPVMAIPQQVALQASQGLSIPQAVPPRPAAPIQVASINQGNFSVAVTTNSVPTSSQVINGSNATAFPVPIAIPAGETSKPAKSFTGNEQQSREATSTTDTSNQKNVEGSLSNISQNQSLVNAIAVSSSNPVFTNDPVTANQPNLVNGGLEGPVGKGRQICDSTQDSKLNYPAPKLVNGQVNGIPSSVESTSKFPLDKMVKCNGSRNSEVNCISKDNGSVINGERVDPVSKGPIENSKLSDNSSLKRKLEETNSSMFENDVIKSKLKEQDICTEKQNIDDILIKRYESDIKSSKKLRLNGVYVNNCKESPSSEVIDDTIRLRHSADEEMMESSDKSKQEEIINGNSESNKHKTDTNSADNRIIDVSVENASTNSTTLINNGEQIVKETVDDIVDATKFDKTSDGSSKEQSIKEEGAASHQENPAEEKNKQNGGRQGHKKCQWAGCRGSFPTSNDLLAHMVFCHAPQEGSLKTCKVPGCKTVQRPRGSMICHFDQVHCSSSSAIDDDQVTLPQLLFPKVVDIEREDESPVTRSVRLTAALILRNIARNSAYGRKMIINYETRLVPAAMSSSEASSAIAACLEELSRKRRKPSDCLAGDEAS